MRLAALGVLLALTFSLPARSIAQEAAPPPVAGTEVSAFRGLLEDRRSSHTIALAGRTLAFTATAGSIPIANAEGDLLADVGFFAYTLDGADARSRPVIFAYNGGPGSSSVWLHLGALGPWRIPLTAATMTAKMPPGLIDNAETWLDFADLVFIDPPGTGHSRIVPAPDVEQGRVARGASKGGGTLDRKRLPLSAQWIAARRTGGPEWFWSLDGDIATFAEVITAWLRRTSRQTSPVILAGESYGGFRTPLIARLLGREHRIPVRAMILISPVLDFDGRRGGHLPQYYTALLPSIAATRMERIGIEPTRERLLAAETYARGDYLLDLARGPRDTAALYRIGERIGELTGMMPEHVRHLNGRVTSHAFVRDNPLFSGQNVSLYDAGMAGIPSRTGRGRGFGDHFTSALDPPLEAAMEQVTGRLGWNADRSYRLMSRETTSNWTWRNSPNSPEVLSTLQALLQADQRMRALVTHGFTDLVTPYFASANQLALVANASVASRIGLEVYAGGHMYYSRDTSRARFKADAERLIGETLQAGGAQDKTERRETP